MLVHRARWWLPALGVGLAFAAVRDPGDLGLSVSLAIPLAAVRIAGERSWSLLPQGLLASALIAPDRWFETLTVAALATALIAGARPTRTSMALVNLVSGALGVFLVLSVHSGLSTSLQAGTVDWRDGSWILLLAIAWFMIDTLLWLLLEPDVRIVYRDTFMRLLRDWRVAVILVSATFTLAAVWHHSPIWAAIAAALPLLLAVRLADQVRRHRVLVDLTVQALGRLPEAAGVAQRGHSKNVTTLAVAMGRVHGMAGREIETLRRAALLHDVGLVAATKPHIGRQGFMTADVSKWGAEVVCSNDELRRETAVIRDMAEPYRTPGADPTETRTAQLIRVACRAISMLEVDPVDQVVEALYADSIYTFDPHAVGLIRPAIRLLGWPALPEVGR